ACTEDETPADPATQPDAAQPEASAPLPVADAGAGDVIPTGDVKGTINYPGDKRGTVVIAFLDEVPDPAAPPAGPPNVGGFALSNPQSFPGTFATKVAPGNWFAIAYMSVGQ